MPSGAAVAAVLRRMPSPAYHEIGDITELRYYDAGLRETGGGVGNHGARDVSAYTGLDASQSSRREGLPALEHSVHQHVYGDLPGGQVCASSSNVIVPVGWFGELTFTPHAAASVRSESRAFLDLGMLDLGA
jgi:hypothetical protein